MTRKNIFVVDDDPDYLFQLKFKLEQAGFNVIPAEGEQEAARVIEDVRPDLAILDLMMEKEDSGFILAYKIKRRYPDVPVIIATGVTAETGLVFDASAEGDQRWIKADLFVDKGIRFDQLEKEIRQLLGRT